MHVNDFERFLRETIEEMNPYFKTSFVMIPSGNTSIFDVEGEYFSLHAVLGEDLVPIRIKDPVKALTEFHLEHPFHREYRFVCELAVGMRTVNAVIDSSLQQVSPAGTA